MVILSNLWNVYNICCVLRRFYRIISAKLRASLVWNEFKRAQFLKIHSETFCGAHHISKAKTNLHFMGNKRGRALIGGPAQSAGALCLLSFPMKWSFVFAFEIWCAPKKENSEIIFKNWARLISFQTSDARNFADMTLLNWKHYSTFKDLTYWVDEIQHSVDEIQQFDILTWNLKLFTKL